MRNDRLRIDERIVILAEIVRQIGEIRRLSLIKMVYLLQTVKKVPLGYDFELYLYGPDTVEVLNDISIAKFWNILQVEYYSIQNGYGHKITLGELADDSLQEPKTVDLLEQYRDAIDWVVENFRNYTTSEMEAIGVLVWIDREFRNNKKPLYMDNLIRIAEEIKPNFSYERFQQLVEELVEKGVLNSLSE